MFESVSSTFVLDNSIGCKIFLLNSLSIHFSIYFQLALPQSGILMYFAVKEPNIVQVIGVWFEFRISGCVSSCEKSKL